jgi:hypothetical protein
VETVTTFEDAMETGGLEKPPLLMYLDTLVLCTTLLELGTNTGMFKLGVMQGTSTEHADETKAGGLVVTEDH